MFSFNFGDIRFTQSYCRPISVVLCVLLYFCRHYKSARTDRQIFDNLFATPTGTEHQVTTAYHLQSNGLDEHFNQTIQHVLRKAVNEKQDEWSKAIDDILFAYRTSVQATMKHTPFCLMFGREARLPIQTEISPESNEQTLEERIEDLADLRKSYSKVAENIKDGQQKQKKLYDAKHGAYTKVKNNAYTAQQE